MTTALLSASPDCTQNPLEHLSLDQLRDRTSMKWRTFPPDVLPLWVAEMDVQLAEPVASRVATAVASGDTGYPTGENYADALASFARGRWGWDGIDAARTAIVPDVMLGIVEVLKLITSPGDPVVVTPPVYAPFYAFVTHADRHIVEAPLTGQGRLDLTTLQAAFEKATARSGRPVLLLSNPHNPTGVAHTRAELEQVGELASRFGVRVISDEIHAPLVLPGATFTPYLSVRGSGDAFALFSASKGWNLAGLKAALLVAGPDAVDDLARLPEEVSHGPSHLGVLAHTAAFAEGGEWLDALLSGLTTNRDLLMGMVAERLPGVRMTRPEATYLSWLDCRGLGLHEPDDGAMRVVSELSGPAQVFLERGRVAVSSGHVFGTGGAGFVRLNFATSRAVLAEAVERMAASLTA
jgi:cystathionine beta-lyase